MTNNKDDRMKDRRVRWMIDGEKGEDEINKRRVQNIE